MPQQWFRESLSFQKLYSKKQLSQVRAAASGLSDAGKGEGQLLGAAQLLIMVESE